MKLCTHCKQPEAMHMGFGHGVGKCLLAGSMMELRWKFRFGDKAEQVYREFAEWNRATQDAEDAAREIGAYI